MLLPQTLCSGMSPNQLYVFCRAKLYNEVFFMYSFGIFIVQLHVSMWY